MTTPAAGIYDSIVVQPRQYQADKKHHITIVGRVEDKEFHIAELASKLLQQYRPNEIDVVAMPLCELDWKDFIVYLRVMESGETWRIDAETIVFKQGEYLGDAFHLLDWLYDTFKYEEYRTMPVYGAIAATATREFFCEPKEYVYLAFSVGEEALSGKLVIELCPEYCPMAVENFVQLCERKTRGQTYQDTVIHRVVKKGWIQGGDVIDGSGGNSVSIYGKDFEDECYAVKHNRKGIVGMANEGRDTNGSQFYITLTEMNWFDNKMQAIGRVVTGWHMLEKLEAMDTVNERPASTCRIVACGKWRSA